MSGSPIPKKGVNISMLSFIANNIDALIPTAAGFYACYIGYRNTQADLIPTPSQERARTIFRIAGPILVLSGIVQLIAAQLGPFN